MTTTRNSPEYIGVLNELETGGLPVGGPKGAKDRSAIADTAFAKTDGGPARFVTNDPLVIERLTRYTTKTLTGGSPNSPLWKRIITNVRASGSDGFLASIPDGHGGTHDVFVVPAISEP